MRVLDTHLHLWDPSELRYPWLDDEPLLNRRLAAPEALEAFHAAGLAPETLVMQADCVPEQALAEVAWVATQRDALRIRGMMAFVPLEEPRAEPWIEQLAAQPFVVGVRRLLQGAPAGLVASPGFLAGARAVAAHGMVFDACVRDSELSEVIALADAVPELTIVLDHLGKPRVGTPNAPASPGDAWSRELHELGQRSNVFCKLSGLPGESSDGWSGEQLTPFLDTAAGAFGCERLMFASDWGASFGDDLVEGYGRWAETVRTWAGADAEDIMFRTGALVYLGEEGGEAPA